MEDPLKFFNKQVRLLWMYNATIHPHGVKKIIVCFDERDETYYPCNLLDGKDVSEKILEIAIQNSSVRILEIIDLEKEEFSIDELESFH
jgi:hypothetical protein